MTTTTTTVDARTGHAAKILARSVCLTLERHYLGNRRKVDVDDLVAESGGTFELDERMFGATKALIDAKELTPVRRVQNQARAFLKSVALPAHHVFGEGSYLVPNALAERVNDRLNALQADLRTEAVKLGARYLAAVERQRAALGPLFKITDYATPEQVVAAFSIDWSFVSFEAPENLETISHALAETAHAKHQARLAAAFDDVLAGLRATALEIVTDLVDRLTPDADGRPRVIRSSALDALREFADLLPLRNLADDVDLAAAVRMVVDRAHGLDVQALRDSDGVRDGLRTAATQAQAALAALVSAGPRRAIRLPGAA